MGRPYSLDLRERVVTAAAATSRRQAAARFGGRPGNRDPLDGGARRDWDGGRSAAGASPPLQARPVRDVPAYADRREG